MQDVLQLADLANDNDQVVSTERDYFRVETISKLCTFPQDEILAEELKKSEYSEVNGESSSQPSTSNFAFPSDKDAAKDENAKSTENRNENSSNGSGIGDGASLPLLLDPPLTEEEISADLSAIINEASDLDELDMMIQSAGPFQHPRSVAQNYGHGQANMYHRQPSYHSHHHHQVSISSYFYSLLGCSKSKYYF